MDTNKSVFVGLSGGVDSSVAALRLLNAGYDVTGVFIKVWHPDFLVCNWEQERLDAMRVAAKLGIPFLTCDAEAEYRDAVAHYFIESYRAGLTPNPDVMCNKEVKFGAFYRFARERGADYIATGHYAQTVRKGSDTKMHRGVDTNKDQSYFLWTLTNEILDHVLFPVGDTTKDLIRAEAAEAGLLTAEKRDSQGVCFLGHIDIPDFLSHYINLEEGDVLDESGAVIGSHKGAFVYTIGQRQGFTLHDHNPNRAPKYVVAKNTTENTVTVSDTQPVLQTDDTLTLTQVNTTATIAIGDILSAQSRYRQKPFTVEVISITDTTMNLQVKNQSEATALGQSCVLYRGEQCVGGGIIS
ncbi:tRNA 2-thiouridine(34) synthase MnmA [Patescibacteria group bacterium]|nr:tRNA 2-thiouridine(34) synthase MnmA [Patescibacteria group bacterium]